MLLLSYLSKYQVYFKEKKQYLFPLLINFLVSMLQCNVKKIEK